MKIKYETKYVIEISGMRNITDLESIRGSVADEIIMSKAMYKKLSKVDNGYYLKSVLRPCLRDKGKFTLV